MLKLKALKTIGTGKDQKIVEYDRVYLNFGPKDDLESYDKTTDGKVILKSQVVDMSGAPLSTDPGEKWAGQRPKNKISVHPVDELFSDALSYLHDVYPTEKVEGKDVPVDPYWTALSAIDYGVDLWTRSDIQNRMSPVKPMDMSAALKSIAKVLLKAGVAKTQEQAETMAKTQLGIQ